MGFKIFGVKWYWYAGILLGVLIILLVLFRSLKRGSSTKNKKDSDTAYLKDLKKLNRIINRVDHELDPDTRLMIMAQALFETGGLGHEVESPVLERNNNLFGMREAQVRERDQLGDIDQDGYANYKDWEQSVKDHRLWLESKGMYHYWLIPDMFVEELKKNQYFEASLFKYKRGLLFYYQGLKNIQNDL